MEAQKPKKSYPTEPKVDAGELPDPFLMPDGNRITSRDEWMACSEAWREMVIDMEYGGMPPGPDSIEIEELNHTAVKIWPEGPKLSSYRLHCNGGSRPFSFCVKILYPSSPGPFPAIINGDGCWWYVTDDIARRVLETGCALVMFNRTEMADDLRKLDPPDNIRRVGGIYEVFEGREYGALSAWAWGYHRCVDLLQQLDFIRSDQIAVTGHSRGGKAALIAGVTDSRITLVNDNAGSGAGSPVFRYVGDGGETLKCLNAFPFWFGSGLRPYIDREGEMPFDQHCLLATVAPRFLLLTYAVDDRWSNPEGLVQSFWAAREVYRFLDIPDDIAFHLRGGEHSHAPEDWDVLLDFISWKWLGKKSKVGYNRHPYEHMRPAFSWKAPDS